MDNRESTSNEAGVERIRAAEAARSDGADVGGFSLLTTQLPFRPFIYAGTFVSGAVALTYQVVWQRYLSFLVGSEARSISLVVAVFLFGLAAGYRFWGNLTERDWSRSKIVKAMGFIEIGLGVYGIIFPTFFRLIQQLAYSGPDLLIFDLLLTGLLLLPPTFLMGASIPLLTAAVPDTVEEVNFVHSRIYGINTLGAVLGALVGGLVLIPTFGLPLTLIFGALASFVVGVMFLLNPLEGSAHKAQDIPRIPNNFGAGGIYLYVFVTGAVSIALEVLFTRIVALSIGSSHVVFPIVVGVVILGLAIGSLSLKRTGISGGRVPWELIKLSVILAILYFTIPYWPYWLSHVRISLATIPSNYWVFNGLVVIFVALLLLPVVIPMGRLLPMGYALIDKTRDDYGILCGRVYFANTLGTVAGAVGVGYLMFLLFDLPMIFKINIGVLLLLAALLTWRNRRVIPAAACAAGALAVLALPGWDRQPHAIGLFRYTSVQDLHFHGLFHMPRPPGKFDLGVMRDDPTMTVSAYEVEVFYPQANAPLMSKTIAVNAKSDGNTVGDYSNMVLAGTIPYLFSPKESGLSAAVVGMGTGMTAGALALGEGVESVTTLEISAGVIQALPYFDEFNFNLSTNPKSHIVQADAFRFFSRSDRKFDIIVSEPSNPWVVGVENLFTPEFYELAGRSLNDDGVFFQWVQLYETNTGMLGAIARNLLGQFRHVSVFAISSQDIGIVASRTELTRPHIERRLAEAGMRRALEPIGLDNPKLFSLLEIYQTNNLVAVAVAHEGRRHSVEHPWLGHEGSQAKFLLQTARLGGPVHQDVGRHLLFSARRREDFASWMAAHADNLAAWCTPRPDKHSTNFVCGALTSLSAGYRHANQPATLEKCEEKMTAYSRLREQGFVPPNLEMLAEIRQLLLAQSGPAQNGATLTRAIGLLASQYALEAQWDLAVQFVDECAQKQIITSADAQVMREEVGDHYERAAKWNEKFESWTP